MDSSADGSSPADTASRPGARLLVLFVALLLAVLVVWLLWSRAAATGDNRPILQPHEFVSYAELPDFVGGPLGAGTGLGSRYSYMLQTLREGSGFVLVETIYTDDELPTAAPRPPTPGSAGTPSAVVDGGGNIAAHTERPPVLLSVSDGCRQVVVSGTGFEPSNAQTQWLEGLISARLAAPGTVGHDFCQAG